MGQRAAVLRLLSRAQLCGGRTAGCGRCLQRVHLRWRSLPLRMCALSSRRACIILTVVLLTVVEYIAIFCGFNNLRVEKPLKSFKPLPYMALSVRYGSSAQNLNYVPCSLGQHSKRIDTKHVWLQPIGVSRTTVQCNVATKKTGQLRPVCARKCWHSGIFKRISCVSAALNMGIRALLRQYEARPPPLAPLAASLRSLSPLCEDPEAVTQPG